MQRKMYLAEKNVSRTWRMDSNKTKGDKSRYFSSKVFPRRISAILRDEHLQNFRTDVRGFPQPLESKAMGFATIPTRKSSVVQNLYSPNFTRVKLLRTLSQNLVELVGIEPFQWIENIQLPDSTMFSKGKKGTNSNSAVQIGTRTRCRLLHTSNRYSQRQFCSGFL
jgi:hypothetical protein